MRRIEKPEPGEYAPYAIQYIGLLPDDGREATITLFDGFDDAALTRSGIANGSVMSVRAAAYHIAGHELHHVNLIQERYL